MHTTVRVYLVHDKACTSAQLPLQLN